MSALVAGSGQVLQTISNVSFVMKSPVDLPRCEGKKEGRMKSFSDYLFDKVFAVLAQWIDRPENSIFGDNASVV